MLEMATITEKQVSVEGLRQALLEAEEEKEQQADATASEPA